MPKFSFVIPVYNCRQYLEECVESVLAQTVPDFEIILVDDGSKDGSGELCDVLRERDSRIGVFHKENGGAGSARNLGIEKAKGEYLLFVDGDDTVEGTLLELVEPFLGDDRSLTVFGMCFDYWGDGGIVKTNLLSSAFPGSHTVKETAEKLPAYFDDNVFSSACNKVFPLKLLLKEGLRFREDVRLYEDLEFVLRCLAGFERIYVIGDGLYHYRNRIEDAHIDYRVADLAKVKADLAPLNRAFLEFGEHTDASRITLSVSANLYASMLEMHLLRNRSSIDEMRMSLPDYASEESFRTALREGAEMDPSKKKLIALIDTGRFSEIRRIFAVKRVKIAVKRMVKHLLGR